MARAHFTRLWYPACLALPLLTACVSTAEGEAAADAPVATTKDGERCTMSPDVLDRVFDNSRIEKTLSESRTERSVSRTVKVRGGPVMSITVGGCARLGMTVATTRLPDGGAGLMPMYRMSWLLEAVPAGGDHVKLMVKALLKEAKKLAKSEEPSGKGDAFYEATCGDAPCSFKWHRHSDMALDLTATYNVEP